MCPKLMYYFKKRYIALSALQIDQSLPGFQWICWTVSHSAIIYWNTQPMLSTGKYIFSKLSSFLCDFFYISYEYIGNT